MKIACPHCLQLNQVPQERLNEGPVCGKCKKALLIAKPITLTEENFAVIVQKSEMPVVIDFWAPWCGPCRSFAPVFADAAKDFNSRMRFAKLNTEDEQKLAAKFAIRSIPTLMVFKNGKMLTQQSGAMPKNMFYQWLEQNAK